MPALAHLPSLLGYFLTQSPSVYIPPAMWRKGEGTPLGGVSATLLYTSGPVISLMGDR